MKPGIKSTEFWLTTIVSLYSMLSPTIPPPFNVIVPGILGGLYIVGRSLVKAGVLRGSVPDILKQLKPMLKPAAGKYGPPKD